jgi:hypothetical protein
MSDGHPDDPLLVYVGRLGAEKNTEALKDILTQVGWWWWCWCRCCCRCCCCDSYWGTADPAYLHPANLHPATLPALLQVPGARLALVGDGPQRQELEQMFQGMPVKFMVSWQRVRLTHSPVF